VATGFFTDTTLCIGCKACEVACKQWNQLPDDGFSFSGLSYDNTVQLGASSWRHVAFVEQTDRWLMQPDICNGCGYCVVSCPFGVIDRLESDGRAWKCTLCYDRQRGGLEPACAKACPTDSIQFGDVDELRARAKQRVTELHARGVTDAYLYGADAEHQPGTDGLHAFFLLVDRPEVYNLPAHPVCPTKTVKESWRSLAFAGIGILAAAIGAVLSARSTSI
jgi:formate dehydrogenase iron-sulfur subunit